MWRFVKENRCVKKSSLSLSEKGSLYQLESAAAEH